MFSGKIRLTIIVEGTPMAVRLVPHSTDSTKVMVKGEGEAPAAFCQAAGISHGPLTQGENFTMTEAVRSEVGVGVASIIDKILEAADTTNAKQLTAEKKLLGASKCEHCGNNDGTHFQFCEND